MSTYKHCFENDLTRLNNMVSAFSILTTEAQASRFGPSYAVVGYTLLQIPCLLSTYTLRIPLDLERNRQVNGSPASSN